MNYYAVTVKQVLGNAHEVDSTDYGHWMCHASDIHQSLEFLETFFEKDALDRLHMHCLVSTPIKRPYLKKLQKYGFNLDWQKLPEHDIDKWRTYIKKDMFKEYAFIDEDN